MRLHGRPSMGHPHDHDVLPVHLREDGSLRRQGGRTSRRIKNAVKRERIAFCPGRGMLNLPTAPTCTAMTEGNSRLLPKPDQGPVMLITSPPLVHGDRAPSPHSLPICSLYPASRGHRANPARVLAEQLCIVPKGYTSAHNPTAGDGIQGKDWPKTECLAQPPFLAENAKGRCVHTNTDMPWDTGQLATLQASCTSLSIIASTPTQAPIHALLQCVTPAGLSDAARVPYCYISQLGSLRPIECRELPLEK